MRRVAVNTAIQASADLVGKLASLGFYVAMARNLGETGFGEFTFSSAVAIVCVAFAAFGTDYVVTRETARDLDSGRRLLWQATAIKLAFGSFGMVLALAFAAISGVRDEVLAAVAIMAVATLIEISTKTLHAVMLGIQVTAPVGISLVIQRVGTAAVGVPLLVAGADLLAVCAIYLLGAVASAGWMLAVTIRRGLLARPRIDLEAARVLLVLAVPIGLNEVFGVVMSRVDIGILALLEDERAVGLYGAAYRLYESTLFLSWGFGTAAFPAFAVLNATSSPTLGRALELGLKVSAVTLIPVGAVLALFAPLLVDLVYGPRYAGSVDALRWLAVAAAGYGFFLLSSFVLIAEGRSKMLALITGGAVVANVVVNFALIPAYSVTGAAAAMAITQLGLSAAMVAAAGRCAGRPSATSVLLAPGAGGVAMLGVALLLGQSIPAVLVAAVCYLLVLLGLERLLHPKDLLLVRELLGRRLGRA